MGHQHEPTTEKIIDELLSGAAAEELQGKQVVAMDEEVHVLPEDDKGSVGLVEKLERKHPGKVPHLVHVPQPEALVV